MELTNKTIMEKLPYLAIILCFLTSCTQDTFDIEPENFYYYYPTYETSITAENIGGGSTAFEPKGIAVANDKLYICNGDVLEVFDALTLVHVKTISNYIKGSTTIALANLTGVCIDNGRIYIAGESRIFVLNELTASGINTVGNGQWWQTLLGAYGITVKNGLLFVKEQGTSIKVFDTSQITEQSNWNLAPIAKLNTLQGGKEIYSMAVEEGNLIVAGRDAKSYLFYNIDKIKNNASSSLNEPIKPETNVSDSKPTAINFSEQWAVTAEIIGSNNYLRIYAKEEFITQKLNALINVSDVLGKNTFGAIVSTAQMKDRLFLSDNTNKKIQVLKLNKSNIAEQKN